MAKQVPSTYLLTLLFVSLSLGCGSPDNAAQDGGTGECTSSADCVAPFVCETFSQTCVAPGDMCASQNDCTNDTYCDLASESCLPSTVGTPCATEENCDGLCIGGFCGCSGVAHDRQLGAGPLDLYLILDATGSMGDDCAYEPSINATAPVDSKACYATYALADYLINVSPATDTRLAFNVMSLTNDCGGADYNPALIPATQLPVDVNSALVQRISDETFDVRGTRIEGALRGLASYTVANKVADREMIGVLITDGEATSCETNNSTLAGIAAAHLAATGIRTFIIGMEGAVEDDLEELAIAGGADPHSDFCGNVNPPCHYWNIGDGSGDVLANALQAIAAQATPLPCEIDVTDLTPPDGEVLDYGQVNVTLTDGGNVVTIPQVPNAAACPVADLAWYYDDPANPATIFLCQFACQTATAAGDGANLSVVAGCSDTVVIVD